MTEETTTLRDVATAAAWDQMTFLDGPHVRKAIIAASDVYEEEIERLRKENERFAEFVRWVMTDPTPDTRRIVKNRFRDVLERAGK